jgi:hypothetical protein
MLSKEKDLKHIASTMWVSAFARILNNPFLFFVLEDYPQKKNSHGKTQIFPRFQ